MAESADEDLAARNRLLAAIVESSQDAIVSKDLNSTVTSWNPGAERIFGYTAAEMVGRSIMTIIPETRVSEEEFILSQVRRGARLEHFETVRRHKSGRLVDISITVSPILNSAGEVVGASKIARDISDRRETENRIKMLLREVNHRVKNQFAVILSMIRETTKRAKSPREFETQVRDRIMALSRSHDLLVQADWRGVLLSDVLEAQLEPFGHPERIRMAGPEVVLQPKAAQYLGMAFHELAANASRFGALANTGGTIDVDWHRETQADGSHIVMTWREHAGAAVGDMSEGGFDRVVIDRIAPAALHGKGRLEIGERGFTWILMAPEKFTEIDPDNPQSFV